jgi:hypothetical protein
MPEEIRHRESLTKSFTPKDTVRSFSGEPSDPTPLPADTPFSVAPEQTPTTTSTVAPSLSSGDGGNSGDSPNASGAGDD